MLTFDLQTQPRGVGYWHFNNSLLDDDIFTTEINRFWTKWLEKKNEFDTPLKWWDKAKIHFKNIAIQRSTQLQKKRRHTRKQLEDKLHRLQRKIADGNNSASAAYRETKSELRHHHLSELATIAARTKIQYTEDRLKQHGGRIFMNFASHRIYTPLLDSTMASNRESFI